MSEWISVEDRLPDHYLPVSCLAEYCAPPYGYYVTSGVLHECHGFYVFNEDGEPETELRMVTHWQPLPEPPK